MQYKPSVFAKMIGVSVKTLQRWDNSGKLKAYRSDTDRRYYTHEQYLKYKGIQEQGNIDIADDLLYKLGEFADTYNMTTTEVLETLICGMDKDVVIGKLKVFDICLKHRQNIDIQTMDK